MAEQVEVHDGGGGVLVNVELLHVHGGDAEDVAVRAVTSRRRSTQEARHTGVVAVRQGAGGCIRASVNAGYVGRNVGDSPVPEAAGDRRIRVEAGQHEGLGAFGESAPGQLRGAVLTTSNAEECGAHPFGGGAAVLNVGGGQGEFGQFGHARVGFAGQGRGANVGHGAPQRWGAVDMATPADRVSYPPARREFFSR